MFFLFLKKDIEVIEMTATNTIKVIIAVILFPSFLIVFIAYKIFKCGKVNRLQYEGC